MLMPPPRSRALWAAKKDVRVSLAVVGRENLTWHSSAGGQNVRQAIASRATPPLALVMSISCRSLLEVAEAEVDRYCIPSPSTSFERARDQQAVKQAEARVSRSCDFLFLNIEMSSQPRKFRTVSSAKNFAVCIATYVPCLNLLRALLRNPKWELFMNFQLSHVIVTWQMS